MKKNRAAVELAALRMVKMTAAERSQVASLGGQARAEKLSEPERKAIGRKGGEKGGKARAVALTPERRKEIAKQAAAARWAKER